MKKTTMIRLTHTPSLLLKKGKHLLMLAAALMIAAMSFAQQTAADEPNSDEISQSGNDTTGDPDVPFDSGIPLLIMAGVAYGAKKLQNAEKKHFLLR